jgi:hypothetical protein
MIWDAVDKQVHRSHIFSLLETADEPAMAHLNGLTRHIGAYRCCQFCSVKGGQKPGLNHYYPVLFKPLNYDIPGCNHEDVDGHHLTTVDVDEYKRCLEDIIYASDRKDYEEEIGITKPSIFSGLPADHMFPVPHCFGSDQIHCDTLNIPDILLSLWTRN